MLCNQRDLVVKLALINQRFPNMKTKKTTWPISTDKQIILNSGRFSVQAKIQQHFLQEKISYRDKVTLIHLDSLTLLNSYTIATNWYNVTLSI